MTNMGLGVLRGQRHIPSKINLSTPPPPHGFYCIHNSVTMVHAQRKEEIMKYMMVIISLFTSILADRSTAHEFLPHFSPVT